MVIIFIGIASAFLILPPNRVVRGDGTLVTLEAASAPHEEIIGMGRLLKDWRIFGKQLLSPYSPLRARKSIFEVLFDLCHVCYALQLCFPCSSLPTISMLTKVLSMH